MCDAQAYSIYLQVEKENELNRKNELVSIKVKVTHPQFF